MVKNLNETSKTFNKYIIIGFWIHILFVGVDMLCTWEALTMQ